MAIIPVYKEQVSIGGSGTPTPQINGPMASASGANISEAVAGLGKSVTEAATGMGAILAHKQELDSQEKVDSLSAKAAAEYQDKLHGDGGLLTRQADAAKGITFGTPSGPAQPGSKMEADQQGTVEYKDSFDGISNEITAKYMGQATTDYERHKLKHALETHTSVLRNAVIAHEGQQARVARAAASEAAVGALLNTAINAVDPEDFEVALNNARGKREDALRLEGHTDNAVINAVNMKTADEFAIAAVKANLDRDPEKAQVLLNTIKGKISAGVKANLQDNIDGKMLDIRRNAVWDQVRGIQNEDKTVNLTGAMDAARKLVDHAGSTIPKGQRDNILSFVTSQAALQDAALKDFRESQSRSFINEALKARNNKIPYDQAFNALIASEKYGFDAKDRDDKITQLQALYTKDESFFDRAMEHQTQAQKLMWSQIEDLAVSKFGTNAETLPGDQTETKLKDAFLVEMKHNLMGLPPEQMWKRANDALKEINVDPDAMFFKEPTETWRIDRDKRNVTNLKLAALEDAYGAESVAQARAYVISEGSRSGITLNPTADQIKMLLERSRSQSGR